MTTRTVITKKEQLGRTYTYEEPEMEITEAWRLLRTERHIDPAEAKAAVDDYHRRVAADEPYEDAIDVDTFRKRYIS